MVQLEDQVVQPAVDQRAFLPVYFLTFLSFVPCKNFTDKSLQGDDLMRHHEGLMAQIKFLAIVDEHLPLPHLLVDKYALIPKAKVTALRSDLVLRLLKEHFLDKEFEILHFPYVLVEHT